MGSLTWITLNPRLKEGINLINNLNNTKFELLLTHISTSDTDELFTENELKKLQDTLKLNESELQLLLQSISYLFKQSNKVILKPTDLQKQLIDILGVEEQKSEIFIKEWTNQTNKDLGSFENRYDVKNISWQINLQTASNFGNRQAKPNARIQLDLSKVTENDKDEKVILEMGEDGLHQLYNTLETIQLRLDNMSKNKN
ncbi:uncharacterized protein LOC115879165 [Sitophilus oryzae]|uniref:Uncharacterized protein LOC115879165 n=1 Tax=Sitophilus oryzae TaxID=7048 RepID=A0A6J2XJN5_SITOR|nr:uncharacterized protein LOC115879165 [Sitophilus oryzae]